MGLAELHCLYGDVDQYTTFYSSINFISFRPVKMIILDPRKTLIRKTNLVYPLIVVQIRGYNPHNGSKILGLVGTHHFFSKIT